MNTWIFLIISFMASVLGAICGIGGGVLMKPILDSLGLMEVSTVSFLSGCTVLSMSFYSVVKTRKDYKKAADLRVGRLLGIGSAIGGVIGKVLFDQMKEAFMAPNTIGAVQAGVLFGVTLGTFIYMLAEKRIRTRQIHQPTICILIGAGMGIFSAFLGIGGGPVNLTILYYCFSMNKKTAAKNSLYIIFLSQIFSLGYSLISGNIPPFSFGVLVSMVLGGFAGGAAGRHISRFISDKSVGLIFRTLTILILMICIHNFLNYRN